MGRAPCAHGDEMTAPEVDPSMDMGGMGPLSHPQHVGDAHSNGERVADVAKIASPRFIVHLIEKVRVSNKPAAV